MLKKIRNGIGKLPKWVFRLVVLTGLVFVILFNDNIEPEFILAYFLFFILLLIIWIIRQIQFLIRLKNEKAKTELLHLKSQVNPHFFFNTMNNLYGLMEKDSVARKMVLKLSDMMRYSIYEGQKDRVTLGQEIEYLKHYIELQKMRYHKQSDVQFSQDVGNESQQIMPLLFIILVENAFKHGLENMEKGAYIHIYLGSTEQELVFTVENNYEVEEGATAKGIGLENLKRRLELVYPKRHILTFEVDANVYKAKLQIKLKA